MTNKLLLSALAISIATPAIIVPIGEAPYEVEATTYKKVFKDVSTKSVNYDIIHEMAEQGIIRGYEDNTFRGANTITRYQAASLIYRYMGEKLPVVNKNVKIPSDVSKKSSHYEAAVALLKADLLKPDAKGKLNPNKPLTRAEMAKILVNVFVVEVKADYDFADTIEADEETKGYVRALYSNGITTGYLEDATFRPEKSLTRSQFAVFMHRSINVDPDFVAEPIVVPGENAETKPTTPNEPTTKPTTPTTKFPAGAANETLVIPNATSNYDRYDPTNMEFTPLSELEGLPTDLNAINPLNRYYDESITGMTYEEYNVFLNTTMNSYRSILLPTGKGSMSIITLKQPGGIEEMAKNLMDGDVNKLIQAFYYVYSTNSVYKDKKIAIGYDYSRDNVANFWTMTNRNGE